MLAWNFPSTVYGFWPTCHLMEEHCPIWPGATWKEQSPFAKDTVCATVSVFLQTGYPFPAMVRTVGDGPLGVNVMKTADRAEPAEGKARINAPRRVTWASSHQRRAITH